MKLDNIFEMSFCINLDKRKDRWEACQKEFYKLNFYPERFSAIEDANPVVGCWKSHLEILKRAQKEKKNVLIFEDDIEIINFEDKLIERVMNDLYDLDWDMWYGSANILRSFYQVSEHLAKLTHAQSTALYGVNKNFLDELILFVEANHTFIDVIYADGVCPVKNCYVSIPMISIQRPDYSDIEKQKVNYNYMIDRYNQFLVRKK